MIRRLKIIMDHERKIFPDRTNNYIIGKWDNTMEDAISKAQNDHREILVIRPEGLKLTIGHIYPHLSKYRQLSRLQRG